MTTKYFQSVKLIDSQAVTETPIGTSTNPLPGAMYVMDSFLLDWVPWDGSSTGGGGGAVTVADGADVAEGAKTDAAWNGAAASASGISLWKYMGAKLEAIRAAITGTPSVSVSNLPATQAISAAALPLPTGAALEAGNLGTIAAKDFATQVTLAAVLAKLTADPATQTTLAAVLAKIIAAPATETKQDTGNTSLAAILAKIIAAPATEATLALIKAKTDNLTADPATQTTLAAVLAKIVAAPALESGHLATIDTSTAKIPAQGQALAASSMPVVLTAIQVAALTPPSAITGFLTESDFDTKTGSLTETAPATDIASSGLNGRLQRIAQRLTSLITALGTPFQAGGSIGNTSFGATQGTAANLNMTEASAAAIKAKTDNIPALGQALAASSVPVVLTAAQIATLTPPAAITGFLTEADFDTKVGSLTETAPASDTASSGLNGRLQRIAQRLTSLITALGSPFQAGGSIGNTTFAATQATAANLNMTEASAAAILAKIIAAPATEATLALIKTKTDNLTADPATQTTLAALLTELLAKTEPSDTQTVKEVRPTIAAISSPDYHNITDATRNLAIVAANASRRSLCVVNKSALPIWVAEGAVASSSSYTKMLAPYEEWELHYPACTVALNGYFPEIPDQPLLVTERS